MDDMTEFDHLLKMVIIGNSGVGKTCLLMKFADNTFTENYTSTIGVDFRVKMLDIEGKKVKLQIWDTAGQERFRTICSSYYRGANGIVIVYDVTDQNSFNNVPAGWAPEVEKNAPEGVVKLIVGTKSDLTENRVISSEQGKELAGSCGALFMETSAKDGTGVDAAFDMLAREALHKMLGTNDKTKKPGTGQDNQKVNLQAPPKTTSAAQKKWKFC